MAVEVDLKVKNEIDDNLPAIDLKEEIENSGTAIGAALAKQPQIVENRSLGFKKIEITAEMYKDAEKEDMSLTEFLETLDPSGNYKPVKTNRGEVMLDAYERQLFVRNLSVYGKTSASFDAFFQTGQGTNRTLFPEFINRNIRIGQLMTTLDVRASDLIADSISIPSDTYKSSDITEVTGDDASLKYIAEGAKFPGVKMVAAEKTVTLRKYGRKIRATYEYLRRVQIPVFAIVLQFIGMRIEKNEAADAVDVLLNGNAGNSNGAANTNVDVSGTLDFDDLVHLWLDMGDAAQSQYGFDMRRLLMNRTRLRTTIALPEFADTAAGNTFAQTGNFYTPLGAKIGIADTLANDILMGLDERFAMIRVNEAGSQLTEADRIIDGQWQEILVSEVLGFVKIFAKAARTLDVVP